MSYDYMLLRLRERVASPADLDPAGVARIGAPDEIRAAVARALPGIRWTDTAGHFEDAGRWLEVGVVEHDGTQSLAVRTSLRRDASDLIERLCEATGTVAFDAQAMRMYLPPDPTADPPGSGRWVPFS